MDRRPGELWTTWTKGPVRSIDWGSCQRHRPGQLPPVMVLQVTHPDRPGLYGPGALICLVSNRGSCLIHASGPVRLAHGPGHRDSPVALCWSDTGAAVSSMNRGTLSAPTLYIPPYRRLSGFQTGGLSSECSHTRRPADGPGDLTHFKPGHCSWHSAVQPARTANTTPN